MKKILVLLLILSCNSLIGCSEKDIEVETTPDVEVYPNVVYDTEFITYMYSNNNDISLDNYIFEDEKIYKSYNWNKSYFGSSVSQNTIFVYEHLIMLPENKDYDLFIRALGDVRVYVGSDFDNLSLKVSNNFTTLSSYDYYNYDTFFTVDNVVGKPIAIRVEVQTSIRAEFYIGMINEIGKIENISDDYIALFKEEL
ncbi:MAG: hypothetical protein R3Y60_03340 [bacterium]